MGYVVSIIAVTPIRAEAAHRSEMVSQLLFGEPAEIIDTFNEFIKIKCVYDGYEGWCQSTQLINISEAQLATYHKDLVAEFTNLLEVNGSEMQVPYGASLGFFLNNNASFGKFNFHNKGAVAKPNVLLFKPDYITHIATAYLNTPYLWGGRSVFGIDCSGFTQQVYRFFDKQLPRDAYQQAALGEVVGFLQEVICGDLAFFDNAEGKITHVGILLNSETIIHSSGRVRIDKIDNVGIVSSDTGERTHQLRIIKRI